MTQLELFNAAKLLGAKGGAATSPAKSRAARDNGRLGGRPRSKPLTRNADGVSIKGCSIIYAPRGQAGEYAQLATNPYRGCGHKCAYCYVPRILRMQRAEFDAGAMPRKNFLNLLRRDARKYQELGTHHEQVLLSFTTDVYNPSDRSLTRPTIEMLVEHDLSFCVLTKGGTRALSDLDLYRPDRDSFAATLTSLDNTFSRRWESQAALPGDRIEALRAFHAAGIFTWVSLEPTLDTKASLQIIRATHAYVNLYKIGRANYLPMTQTTDWHDYTLRIIELCKALNVQHYIKRDLQRYLPAGYRNPLHPRQHF